MEHREESIPAFEVTGLQIRTSNARAMETIGPLWGRVYGGGLAGMAPTGQQRLYAVYSNYEGDHNGEYDYTIGYAVNAGDPVPEGMTQLGVPRQRYAVIIARGEMPGALVETWMQIWEAGLPRAFAIDFEIHDPATPGEVEIWLSLAEGT